MFIQLDMVAGAMDVECLAVKYEELLALASLVLGPSQVDLDCWNWTVLGICVQVWAAAILSAEDAE